MVISYLIWGLFATFVNIAGYYVLTEWFDIPYLISNAIAWLLAIFFAFLTNKYFVFNLKSKSISDFWREISFFYCCRLLSGVLDMGLMFLLVSVVSVNTMISKVLVSLLVIVFNFMISKYFIFV